MSLRGISRTGYDPFAFLSVTLGLRLDYFNLTERVLRGTRGAAFNSICRAVQSSGLPTAGTKLVPIHGKLSRDNGNPEVKENTATHYILELEREISAQTRLKVAGYQKDFRDLITRDQVAGYLNQGQGYARGIEISLKHRAGDRFFAWANYGYSVSKREDRPGDPERLYFV